MRRAPPGPLRLVYWVVMLIAIAVLVWYIRGVLGQYGQVGKP
jgi:hypothetical protein